MNKDKYAIIESSSREELLHFLNSTTLWQRQKPMIQHKNWSEAVFF